ncbi:MAG TPA: translation initiation factor IF-2 subunit beta [Candidatus Nanoarchaeia archaeon]|nr:translation initiation factor IF-2 subunit beta [Candidatus Nanoarchaeia archaeon]
MDPYEQLLEKAKKQLPEVQEATERLAVPNVRGHVEGNKTIISNFFEIADLFQRKPEHLLKYILKELAAPGEFKKQLLILGTKVPAGKINDKIKQYADELVLCKECGKPDTKLTKDAGITFIKCQACGAKHSVYSKI